MLVLSITCIALIIYCLCAERTIKRLKAELSHKPKVEVVHDDYI